MGQTDIVLKQKNEGPRAHYIVMGSNEEEEQSGLSHQNTRKASCRTEAQPLLLTFEDNQQVQPNDEARLGGLDARFLKPPDPRVSTSDDTEEGMEDDCSFVAETPNDGCEGNEEDRDS